MQQVFEGPVRKVRVTEQQVHNYWPDTQPPDNPEKSIQCWQCERLTWRYTRHCVHCAVKLRRGMLGMLRSWIRGK